MFKLSASPVPNQAQKSSPSGRKYDFLIVGITAKESITKFVTKPSWKLESEENKFVKQSSKYLKLS